MMNLESDLRQFTGTENYYRHWIGNIVFTDGVRYLAEKAGAMWLIDAIASYQNNRKVCSNLMLQEFQLWILKVNNGKAVLTCQVDTGTKPVVTQRIEYTDFPLAEIKLYVEPMGNGRFCLLLPSEH
jgi:hypothetical protein